MRDSRFGRFLLGVGALVGVAASVAYLAGFKPSQLPATLLDIAAYKLAFVAALVLMGAGAMVRRYAARDASLEARLEEASAAPALGSGTDVPMSELRPRERVGERQGDAGRTP